MLIINPTFGHGTGGGEQRAIDSVDWNTVPIALFTNAKPNARELLTGVREHLATFRDVSNVQFEGKDSASQPAPDAVIEHVANNYGAAILAIAD
ncbi:MAG: hypothetical protein AAF458_16265 [Pseudomonadota bacterium]